MRSLILAVVALTAGSLLLAGCDPEPNPITPDKMEEIRKAEGDQRANFNPTAPPKGQ